MGNNRGFWIIVSLLLAGSIYWGVGYAVNPSSGDTEFQKTLEAMKQVKSFRGAFIQSASSGWHSEKVWEVDCSRVMVHQQTHDAQAGHDSPFEMKEEELLVGNQRYIRDRSGSWEHSGYSADLYSAQWYCNNIAQGTVRDLLPNIREMLRHAMIGKGDKKTVNGVRCQEWLVALRGAGQQTSVCIGVDDHLPYEMTMEGGHYSYSDYNRPVQFDVPESVVEPASATDESN